MPLDEIKKEFMEAIDQKGRDDHFIDIVEEEEIHVQRRIAASAHVQPIPCNFSAEGD